MKPYTTTQPGASSQYCQYLCLRRTTRDRDRKSTRLNSSHLVISYAVFCLKKKKKHSVKCLTVLSRLIVTLIAHVPRILLHSILCGHYYHLKLQAYAKRHFSKMTTHSTFAS